MFTHCSHSKHSSLCSQKPLFNSGAVSCIAAAFGGTQHVNTTPFETKRELTNDDAADLMRTMDGSRVVAGTTAGDLRVWSGKLTLALRIPILTGGLSPFKSWLRL